MLYKEKGIAYDAICDEWSAPMQESRTDREWEDLVKGMLKGELKRRGITYAGLVGKLADIGVVDSEPNIRNKLARGKFTAVFFVQCLEAIGSKNITITERP